MLGGTTYAVRVEIWDRGMDIAAYCTGAERLLADDDGFRARLFSLIFAAEPIN
jgi:hypothetical protein